MSRSKGGGSGTSPKVRRARACFRPDRASTSGNHDERPKRVAGFPGYCSQVSGDTRHPTSGAAAASTRALPSTSSNDPDPRGRRLPSWARSRSGARSSSTNEDGEVGSPIPPGSDWSAPCARGSNRGPVYPRWCTRSGAACTRCARPIEVGSRCPTGVVRNPPALIPGRSDPGSSRHTRSTCCRKTPSGRCSSGRRRSRVRTCLRSASCRWLKRARRSTPDRKGSTPFARSSDGPDVEDPAPSNDLGRTVRLRGPVLWN